jgi:hypothetical protein
MDNMSVGECDMVEDLASQQEDKWMTGGKNKSKKRVILLATRQSQRLKKHGGISVEEMASKRKQLLNLEPGTKKIPFCP